MNLYTYRAKAVRCIDGDTVALIVDLGMDVHKAIHVRVAGVDCPEANSPDPAVREAADAATFFTMWWLTQRTGKWPLTITTHKDRRSFTRYIADIYDEGGHSLADALIENGHGR
jgi:micrococcal nuclease